MLRRGRLARAVRAVGARRRGGYCAARRRAAAAAGARFSPADATRTGPHKYFLAEAYSGANAETMAEKVAQLETQCSFLCARWAELHDGEAGAGAVGDGDRRPATTDDDDATKLIGAAALVFSAGAGPRRTTLGTALAIVCHAAKGPILSRLARAGRLLVVVLDSSQSPTTHFERGVASRLERLDRAVADVQGGLADVQGGLADVRAGLADVRAGLREQRDGMARIEAAVAALMR